MSEVPFQRSIFARLALIAIAVSAGVTLLLWSVTAATIDRTGRAALSRARPRWASSVNILTMATGGAGAFQVRAMQRRQLA